MLRCFACHGHEVADRPAWRDRRDHESVRVHQVVQQIVEQRRPGDAGLPHRRAGRASRPGPWVIVGGGVREFLVEPRSPTGRGDRRSATIARRACSCPRASFPTTTSSCSSAGRGWRRVGRRRPLGWDERRRRGVAGDITNPEGADDRRRGKGGAGPSFSTPTWWTRTSPTQSMSLTRADCPDRYVRARPEKRRLGTGARLHQLTFRSLVTAATTSGASGCRRASPTAAASATRRAGSPCSWTGSRPRPCGCRRRTALPSTSTISSMCRLSERMSRLLVPITAMVVVEGQVLGVQDVRRRVHVDPHAGLSSSS